MAKKPNNPSMKDLEKGLSEDVKMRSYKNEGKGFDELDESAEIMGVFLTIRDQEITDKRTKARKMIRVYSIRNKDGQILRIGSRAILDRLFDDIMDEHGGYTVENRRYRGPGIDWISNRVVKFVRGEDSETADGNPLGTYEIQVEED